MNFLRHSAKVFAFLLLLFSNLIAQDSIYRLDTGMKIRVKMDVEISSAVSTKNDTFIVRTAGPIKSGETVVLAEGTLIEGRVIESTPALNAGRPGSMLIRFERIKPDGADWQRMDAAPVKQLRGNSTANWSAFSIIGGTAIGALIGGLTGSGKGALIGAGLGAGGGTAVAYARKGKDIRIKSGEVVEIVLKEAIVLPVKDF